MPVERKKEEEPETVTPIMQQTEQMIRQQLINHSFTAKQADAAIQQASLYMKDKETKVPQAIQKAFEEARDLLYLMPRLMEKGYTADEAAEVIDAARKPKDFNFFLSNRIQDYDVSTLKEALDYIKLHKKEDYSAAMAGLMFKGPSRALFREKAEEEPKPEVLPNPYRSQEEPKTKVAGVLPNPYRSQEEPKPEVLPNPYRSQGEPKTKVAAKELEPNPYISGREAAAKERPADAPKELEPNPYIAESAGRAAGARGKPATAPSTEIELNPYHGVLSAVPRRAEKAAYNPAEPGVVRNFSYQVDIEGEKYNVSLNTKLKGVNLKAELLEALKKPGTLVTLVTPMGQTINQNLERQLRDYATFLASQCRSNPRAMVEAL